jgi:hypothetical protein
VFGLMVASFSGSASADWQGTVWNMTVEAADKNFRVPHRAPTPREIYDWAERKLVFTYTAGDLNFDHGALLFKDGKLDGISMRLREPLRHCNKLVEILRRTYGAPAKEAPDKLNPGSRHFITWYDEKTHNQIDLEYRMPNPLGFREFCLLSYEPFILPAPGSF